MKPITSRRHWQRDQTPIQKQNKLQQTKHRGSPANQTQRCLSKKKKKKIPNTQTKTKPSNPRSHRHRRRRSSLVVIVVALPVAPHRRLQIALLLLRCLVLGAPSDPLSRYFSLFLFDSLSVSLSLSHWNEKMKWIVDRRSVIALRLCLCSGERCSLLPLAVRPFLKVFLSNSLSDSQSLSVYLTERKNEMKFMKPNLSHWTSLSLYFNLSKSLSLLNCEHLIGWLLLFFCFCLFKFGFIFLSKKKLALSYPFLLVSVLVLVKYWLSFSVTCVVICDWHCEIFWLQPDIVIGVHVVLVCCLLSGVGRG